MDILISELHHTQPGSTAGAGARWSIGAQIFVQSTAAPPTTAVNLNLVHTSTGIDLPVPACPVHFKNSITKFSTYETGTCF
eukprot:SAG31_NODE_9720_length_1237_cov_1.273286_2_plen_80_part_01